MGSKPPPEPYPAMARHTGAIAKDAEPWPSKGPWTDRFGEGRFSIERRGPRYELFESAGRVYAAAYPELLEVGRDGQSLTSIPAPEVSDGEWEYDHVWVGEGCAPCVVLDRPRHYANNSSEARTFERSEDQWRERERASGGRPAKTLTWIGERSLTFDDAAEEPRWDDGSDAPLPSLPDYDAKRCRPFWDFVGSFHVAQLTIDDAVYLALGEGECGPDRASVAKFGRDGKGRFLPPLPNPDMYVRDIFKLPGGEILVVGKCSRTNEYQNDTCVDLFDGERWRDEGAELDGMDIGSVALQRDGTLWIVLAHDGDGRTGLGRPRGPCPGGEVHRRSPDGKWELVEFPRHELPGWTNLRFAPLELALASDVPWLFGKWYYVRKPAPETVETRTYGGLFKLRSPR